MESSAALNIVVKTSMGEVCASNYHLSLVVIPRYENFWMEDTITCRGIYGEYPCARRNQSRNALSS